MREVFHYSTSLSLRQRNNTIHSTIAGRCCCCSSFFKRNTKLKMIKELVTLDKSKWIEPDVTRDKPYNDIYCVVEEARCGGCGGCIRCYQFSLHTTSSFHTRFFVVHHVNGNVACVSRARTQRCHSQHNNNNNNKKD